MCILQFCLLSHLPYPFACHTLQNHIPKKEILLNIILHYHKHKIEDNQRNIVGLFKIIQDYSRAKYCPIAIFSPVFCPVKLWQKISIEMKHLQKIFQGSLGNSATSAQNIHTHNNMVSFRYQQLERPQKENSDGKKVTPPSCFTEPRY